jgi:predicted MPP superfamily phosphohydrolase
VVLPGWEGLTVCQLTDLHFGLVTPVKLLEAAVTEANATQSDVTVLTGDFVCRGSRHISQITRTLEALRGPVFAVLGNHDHWVAADAVRRALERAGVVVLQNDWTALEVNGRSLAVVGMDDSTTGNDDAELSVKGLDRPALGLTHNPAAAPSLWAAGVRGVLSGHTHAGQVHVKGVTRPLYAKLLGQPYCDGLVCDEAGWVYVSAGVGAGAIPWRGGERAQREVTRLQIG